MKRVILNPERRKKMPGNFLILTSIYVFWQWGRGREEMKTKKINLNIDKIGFMFEYNPILFMLPSKKYKIPGSTALFLHFG